MVNFAISLGQLFRKHKLIGAILSYLGLNTVISMVTGIFSALALFLIDFEATQAGQALNGYMIGYLSSMSILMLILTVVMYWLCCHIMTKKLNLEWWKDIFTMNQKQYNIPRLCYERNIKNGSANLLYFSIFTVINIVLLFTNANLYGRRRQKDAGGWASLWEEIDDQP